MDPQDPSSFNHRLERLSTGRVYHFVDEGDVNSNVTCLLLHGFPDNWYGYRYQIGPWARRGWRVVVPDMLGYGGTDKPTDVSAYSTRSICNDLAALLDLIHVDKVVIVGHDWGAETAWRFCLWHPERVMMVAGLAVPFYPPAPSFLTLEQSVKKVPSFGYQIYLARDDSIKEIESNLATFFDLLFRKGNENTSWAEEGQLEAFIRGERKPKTRQDLLTPQEFEFYVSAFKDSMTGPVSYYKTKRLRYDEEKAAGLPSRLPVSLPALLLRGTEDPSSPPSYARRAKNFVPSLTLINLDDAGHWLMVERKDEVTARVGDWIDSTLRQQLRRSKL